MDKNLTIHISLKEYEGLKNKVADLQNKLDITEFKLVKSEVSIDELLESYKKENVLYEELSKKYLNLCFEIVGCDKCEVKING